MRPTTTATATTATKDGTASETDETLGDFMTDECMPGDDVMTDETTTTTATRTTTTATTTTTTATQDGNVGDF